VVSNEENNNSPTTPDSRLLLISLSYEFVNMQTGVAGVEQRLGRKVMMSSKNRTGKQELNTTNNRYWNSGSGGNKNNTQADKEDSSDESEGRGASIGKGKKRNELASMRADLLASGGSKKRKTNRNSAGGGG
jgi:hypothetical protein